MSELKNIPVARPWLGEREAEAAKRPILSGWVTQGPEVAAFENEFAAYVGANYACAVSSCTTALHLALLAADVGPGDEVITVSHSFIATANSIRYCGAKPVFVDIDPATFNIDPATIEQVITPATKAILCVHQMGMPCDLNQIVKIAKLHSLPVIEDAACAIGSEILYNGNWGKIGQPQGDVACFSFHPRKIITTGDGGMLTTNRKDWNEKFHLLRVHGMSMSAASRHSSQRVEFEAYTELGYNYRMTDIQAAIGREQLKRLPEIIKKRRSLAERYRHMLRDYQEVAVPIEPEWARSNWQSYCVRLPAHCDQLSVMQHMLDAGIATRRGIMCAHREPAYSKEPWSCKRGSLNSISGVSQHLVESELAQDHCILLPLFHQMTEADQDRVIKTLRSACNSQTRLAV